MGKYDDLKELVITPRVLDVLAKEAREDDRGPKEPGEYYYCYFPYQGGALIWIPKDEFIAGARWVFKPNTGARSQGVEFFEVDADGIHISRFTPEPMKI